MFSAILLLLVGFIVVLLGADALVKGASSIAAILKIPEIVIGLTIVAFGTSAPELVVSIMSAIEGHNDIVFGNVIGSNLFNLLVILGFAGLVYPFHIKRNTVHREIPMSLFVVVVVFILVNDKLLSLRTINILSFWDGIILLLLFTAFLWYTYTLSKKGHHENESVKIYSWYISSGMIIGGLVGLMLGGKLVVSDAVKIAEMIGISQKVIGLTIVAAGTSIPELATSVVAAMRKRSDIAIGNVVGSNIFNVLLILGVSSIITPAKYNSSFNTDIYLLCGVTMLLYALMFIPRKHRFDRWNAGLFLVIYLFYIIFLIRVK